VLILTLMYWGLKRKIAERKQEEEKARDRVENLIGGKVSVN
jgi:hypothetical protein